MEVDDLRELAEAYPYSQVIQLLYGLRLRFSSGHLFNQQLGRAAALSNDRSVLFELFENKAKPSSTPPPLSVVADEEPSERTDSAKTVKFEPQEIEEAQKSVSESESSKGDEEEELPDLQQREDTVVSEAPSPQIEKPADPPPTEEPAKTPKVEVPELPENMSELSPQDRVKAILERNKAIREQFEAERSTSNEKLFSSAEDSQEEKGGQGDAPIDIASLVQRRHESNYGGPEESSEQSDERPETELSEGASADRVEEEATAEIESSSEEANASEEPAVSARESEAEADSEDHEEAPAGDKAEQGDMALATRIRIIRDRLEMLKESDALSEEELQALMEEHQRLESLMTELPLDEERVFDIELEEPEDTSSEEQSAVAAEDTAAEEDQKTEETAEADKSESSADIAPEEDGAELDAEIERIEKLAQSLKADTSVQPDLERINAMREEQLKRLEQDAKALGQSTEKEELESNEAEDQPAAEEGSQAPSQSEAELTAATEEEAEEAVRGSEENAASETQDSPEFSPAQAEKTEETPSEETEAEEESLSFSDWLKRIKLDGGQGAGGPREEIKAKVDLLDSFVEKLPDLKKQSRSAEAPKVASVSNPSPGREESEGLGMVTETLAKVYIKQKHYKKAIQAYEILKLKYPEKSSFFASQILEIKKLAKSN